MSLKKIINLFYEILLYNTVIPFRLLSVSKKVKLDKQILDKLKTVRMHSLYPNIINLFFPKIFKKLSQKTGISENLFFLCTPEELISIDEGTRPISESYLKLRKDGCYFIKDKKWHFTLSTIDKFEVISNQSELKGSIAFKGVVKGTVKIVNKPSDMDKFSKGNILVSINTNPSLMPIISQSKAIITDEGGITCHAAIVSRELKKPCIIGTKNATKTLKDGDRVEVDANKGIIKILNSKKTKHP